MSVKPHGENEVVVVIDDVDWDEENQVWKPWSFVMHRGVAGDRFAASDLSEDQLKGLGQTIMARLAARYLQLRKKD